MQLLSPFLSLGSPFLLNLAPFKVYRIRTALVLVAKESMFRCHFRPYLPTWHILTLATAMTEAMSDARLLMDSRSNTLDLRLAREGRTDGEGLGGSDQAWEPVQWAP